MRTFLVSPRRLAQAAVLMVATTLFLGAGDDARFVMLGHKLMCVCGCNQILLECNHVGCSYSTRMRDELAAATDRGDNDDLTLQSFVQKYGPTVIAAPTVVGFNVVAWIMPFAVLIVGIGLVVYVVRTWKKRPPPGPPGGVGPVSGDELDKFKEQARSETEL
jgi:cytochrome c-type biogenesis protein CcmH/NrfF